MATQLKKGTLELLVLSLLSHREWYGYELTQELNKALIVKDATIYLILQRLEKAAYVVSHIQQIPNETKVRKYYQLTASGQQQLDALITEWRALDTIVIECLEQGGITND